jgi:Bacterial sugar transferase
MSTDALFPPVTIQRLALSRFERAVKRALDIVVSITAIAFLSPLFLIAAAAVKLDNHGQIIFRQRRSGFNAKEFVIFKFRTMTVLEDGPVVAQACRDDLRVTRIGKFLRRSSLDELPQLFNVLRGDMSLVGPRPHALAHDDEYRVHIADYATASTHSSGSSVVRPTRRSRRRRRSHSSAGCCRSPIARPIMPASPWKFRRRSNSVCSSTMRGHGWCYRSGTNLSGPAPTCGACPARTIPPSPTACYRQAFSP